MKFLRYMLDGDVHFGLLAGDHVAERLMTPPFAGVAPAGIQDDLKRATILAPVDAPRIFGLGYNYLAHAQETGKPIPDLPVLFMKPSTSAVGPRSRSSFLPMARTSTSRGSSSSSSENARGTSPRRDALDVVLGYTCGNDVSDRILQRRESAFGCLLAGKGYDSFAPIWDRSSRRKWTPWTPGSGRG